MEILYVIGGLLVVTLSIVAWKRRFIIGGTASFTIVLYLIFRSDEIQTIEIPNVCAIGILLTFTLLILSIPPNPKKQNQREAHQ